MDMSGIMEFVSKHKVKLAIGAVVLFVLLGWSFGYVPQWPE